MLPDPNVTGIGLEPASDPEAQALFARGLESLTSLRSVRYTQRLGDGGGSLYRSQTAVSAADAERPAAYADTIVDAAGDVIAQQVIVGDRRWILVGEDWVAAEPIPFLTPAAWGEAYVDATGFQFGPREEVDGELSQVVTFWQPPRASPVSRTRLVRLVDRARQRRGAARGDGLHPALHGLRLQRLRRAARHHSAHRRLSAGSHPSHSSSSFGGHAGRLSRLTH